MMMSAPTVRILVCGTADRGDDGAALAAIAHILPALPQEICSRIEVRRCPQLDAADFVDVGAGETCLIVDTAIGIPPGSIVVVPISELASRVPTIAPRSSHALPMEQVLLVAKAIRGSLPEGRFIGIGGKWFGYGGRFSRAVRAGLPDLEATLRAELVSITRADVPVTPGKGTSVHV
jgi:hydrogenase maturation protease